MRNITGSVYYSAVSAEFKQSHKNNSAQVVLLDENQVGSFFVWKVHVWNVFVHSLM